MHKHTFAEYLQALADTDVSEKIADISTKIALLLNDEGDYPHAQRYAQDAVDAGLPTQKGEASYQLARALFMQGKTDPTIAAIEQAMAFFQANDQQKEVGKCYNMLGAYYTNGQDFQTALDFFEQAIEHNEKTQNYEQLERVFGHLAIFVRLAMPVKNILTFYQNLYEDALPAQKAFIKHNIGIFYRQEQKNEQALEAFQECLSILQDENIKYKLAETSYQIASLQDLKGEAEMAFHFYLAALGQSLEEENPERVEMILYYFSHALADVKEEELRNHVLILIKKAEEKGYKIPTETPTEQIEENPDLAYPADEPVKDLNFTSRLAEVAQLEKSLSIPELEKRYQETEDVEIGLIWLRKLFSQYQNAWFGRKAKLKIYEDAKALLLQNIEKALQNPELSDTEKSLLQKVKTEMA